MRIRSPQECGLAGKIAGPTSLPENYLRKETNALMRRLALILILLSPSCSRLRPPPSALDRLKPCPSSEAPTDAYCGKVEVWENRAAQSGRKLALKVVLLPGLRRELFRNLQADRDIVLVDQRSNALD